MQTHFADRLNAVLDRIERAARGAGRPAPTLVAVSKRHDAGCVIAVTHAWRARGGAPVFGENYVQEALPKRAAVDAALGNGATGWHCIGHLQRNKAREAAGGFDCVQTVDRVELATALARHRDDAGTPLDVLVQVNIDAEASKSGCLPADVPALCASVASLPALRLRGLMAIPAAHADPRDARPALRAMRVLFEATQRTHPAIDTLSMGMSDDLEVAIEEGATLVRVGTAIFGSRD